MSFLGCAFEAIHLSFREGRGLMQHDAGWLRLVFQPICFKGADEQGKGVVPVEVRLAIVAADPSRSAADNHAVTTANRSLAVDPTGLFGNKPEVV